MDFLARRGAKKVCRYVLLRASQGVIVALRQRQHCLLVSNHPGVVEGVTDNSTADRHFLKAR